MMTLNEYLAQQDRAQAEGEALVEWALEQGLDPEAPETQKAWEEDLEAAEEAWLEERAEARACPWD